MEPPHPRSGGASAVGGCCGVPRPLSPLTGEVARADPPSGEPARLCCAARRAAAGTITIWPLGARARAKPGGGRTLAALLLARLLERLVEPRSACAWLSAPPTDAAASAPETGCIAVSATVCAGAATAPGTRPGSAPGRASTAPDARRMYPGGKPGEKGSDAVARSAAVAGLTPSL